MARVMKLRAMLVPALLLSVGPDGLHAQGCADSPDAVAEVRAVAIGIVDADNARDLDRVLGYYAPDATLHPPGEGPVTGLDAIRPRYEDLFEGFDPAIDIEVGDVEVCGTLAVVTGRNTGVLIGRDGSADRSLSDRFVMVLRQGEGKWRITRLIWHPDRG